MVTKLAAMRVDVSPQTGEIMLLIETACGFRPVIGWPDRNGLKDFAKSLLSISADIEDKHNRKIDLSELESMFGDDDRLESF